jgi:hypothetical protein
MSKPEYPKPVFAIRLEAALKVRGFISSEPARVYLGGARIEACPEGGALAVATDGHRLGVSRDADGLVIEPVTVRLPKLLKAERALLPQWLVGVLTGPSEGYIAVVDGSRANDREDDAEHAIERVEECALRIGHTVISTDFVEWRRIIPEIKPDAITRTFNRDYLRSFGEHITLSGSDELEPHIVQTSDRDFFGVLMPMRAQRRPFPEWLNAEAKKKAA